MFMAFKVIHVCIIWMGFLLLPQGLSVVKCVWYASVNEISSEYKMHNIGLHNSILTEHWLRWIFKSLEITDTLSRQL